MLPSVYEYSDPQAYLRDVLAEKQRQNPLFSARAWSRQMKFRCHTSLVLLLNGKRRIRPEHLERLQSGLRLAGTEEEYLRTLVELKNARSAAEASEHEAKLKLLAPAKEALILETERFKTISEWIHMAILEMTKLRDFNPAPEWIAKRLRFGATPAKAAEAIKRLVDQGLLARKDDQLVKTHERMTTPKDRVSESIREHHKQVLTNAIDAVETQTVQERVYDSCTMTVDSSRLEEAKKLILKFRADMARLMEKDGGDETYQLSVQFFRLTQGAEGSKK